MGESGTPPSLHRYLYAYSNPTVYVDLYGYENVKIGEGYKSDLFFLENSLIGLGYEGFSLKDGEIYYDFKDVEFTKVPVLTDESTSGDVEKILKATLQRDSEVEAYKKLLFAGINERSQTQAAKVGFVATASAVTLGQAAPIVAGLSDKALYAHIAVSNSKLLGYAMPVISGAHIYGLATNEDHAGTTMTIDSATGISSVSFAVANLRNAGRNIVNSRAVQNFVSKSKEAIEITLNGEVARQNLFKNFKAFRRTFSREEFKITRKYAKQLFNIYNNNPEKFNELNKVQYVYGKKGFRTVGLKERLFKDACKLITFDQSLTNNKNAQKIIQGTTELLYEAFLSPKTPVVEPLIFDTTAGKIGNALGKLK